ncbi:MAG: hypothetical protein GX957_08050, partial [Clostridiaceae bacterium]|nr:hypothetical protein [Clostridiaceae bacterium]
MKQKCRIFFVLCIILCIMTSTIVAGAVDQTDIVDEYDVSITTIQVSDQDEKTGEETAAETPKFMLEAKSAILIEAETGKVL